MTFTGITTGVTRIKGSTLSILTHPKMIYKQEKSNLTLRILIKSEHNLTLRKTGINTNLSNND